MPRCPHCGAELDADEARAVAARATGINDSWEALRPVVGPPGSIAVMLAGPGEAGPTWWLPSLSYLAYQTTDRADARAALDEFARRRDELGYAVVEEQTDEVIGFTIQPWPLVDRRGRLRFPIGVDPARIEAAAPGLAELVGTHRRRWYELGLLQEELVGRQIQIGDAYAVLVADEPDPSRLAALPGSGEEHLRYIGGLLDAGGAGTLAVPIVDISWDAREAGKLAHYAAAAGVIPAEPDPATAPVVAETETRYLIGFSDGVDPRDVHLGPESTA